MFTKIEQEAIILNAVLEMINGMVNYGLFMRPEKTENINLMFETSAHMRLFNILLVDFLSLPQRGRANSSLPFDLSEPPRGTRPSNRTFLFYVRQICDAPQLCKDAGPIRKPLETFADWLDGEAFVKGVWLNAINAHLDMRIRRIDHLKICGDIGKHSFARLEVNVDRICRILEAHGRPTDKREGYSALPEFYDWFHRHVLAYQATFIAELLNNLRWGIHEYLRPEFERSFQPIDPSPMYRFNYPADITDPLAQEMYWELMNMVRSKPSFPRFTTSPSLRLYF